MVFFPLSVGEVNIRLTAAPGDRAPLSARTAITTFITAYTINTSFCAINTYITMYPDNALHFVCIIFLNMTIYLEVCYKTNG